MSLSRFVRYAIASATVVAAATFAPVVSAGNEVFLEVEGVQGESMDDQFKYALVVNTFTFGISNPTGTRPVVDALTITKKVDKASPKLFVAAATGEHLKSITLSNRRTTPEKQIYYKVRLTDVLVSSVRVSEGTDVLEQISFTFSKVEIEYRPQNPNGSLAPPVKTGYDVKAAKIL